MEALEAPSSQSVAAFYPHFAFLVGFTPHTRWHAILGGPGASERFR
jgi:hypothetical protein